MAESGEVAPGALESWLTPQVESMTALWSSAVQRFYPELSHYWTDPLVNVESLNYAYLEAFEGLPWAELVPRPGTRVLDLACGTGWLAARLSRMPNVARIEAVDIDRAGLVVMLPQVVERLEGDAGKIHRILGLFEPVQRPDRYYDLVTASSAIHHAPNLFSVLRELRRVVADDGSILLLNETPRTFEEYLDGALQRVHMILDQTTRRESGEYPFPLSTNGFCSDPYLGDQTYSYHHYHNAIVAAGLTYRVHKTGRSLGSGQLVHFVCKPAPPGTAPPALADVEGLSAADISEPPPGIQRAVQDILRAAFDRRADPAS